MHEGRRRNGVGLDTSGRKRLWEALSLTDPVEAAKAAQQIWEVAAERHSEAIIVGSLSKEKKRELKAAKAASAADPGDASKAAQVEELLEEASEAHGEAIIVGYLSKEKKRELKDAKAASAAKPGDASAAAQVEELLEEASTARGETLLRGGVAAAAAKAAEKRAAVPLSRKEEVNRITRLAKPAEEWPCEYCSRIGKPFASKQAIRKHIKKHHHGKYEQWCVDTNSVPRKKRCRAVVPSAGASKA